jgi:hypothetical protein
MTPRTMTLGLLCLALLPLAAPARIAAAAPPPGPETTFVVSGGSCIVRADFSAGTASTVVCEPGAAFRGLAVRNDLRLAVVDQAGGGLVRLYDGQGNGGVVSAAIPFPSGLAQDPDGELFVTTSKVGAPGQVWRIPRLFQACPDSSDPFGCPALGYGPAVPIDSEVRVGEWPVERLVDVKYVPFTAPYSFLGSKKLGRGDIVVLTQHPPALLRYADPETCTGNCAPDVVLPSGRFVNFEPTGVAFSENGEILVSTTQGRVMRFRTTSQPLSDFAWLDGPATAIAVGLDQGAKAFVSRAPSLLVRFRFAHDGRGVRVPNHVDGLSQPHGVSLATGSAAPTLVGGGRIDLTNMVADFEKVTKAGLSHLYCVNFADPRESESAAEGLPKDAPLSRALALNESGLPAALTVFDYPNLVPAHLRSFPSRRPGDGEEPTGPPTFHLCKATTTAVFSGLVQSISHEDPWLGYEPGCSNAQDGADHHSTADPFLQSRFAYSEEPPEAPIFEGRTFIDATTICNNDGSRAWKFGSLYMPSVRDTRPFDGPGPVAANTACQAGDGIVDCKLGTLASVLDANECMGGDAHERLRARLQRTIQLYDGDGDQGGLGGHDDHGPAYCGAREELADFLRALTSERNGFRKCPPVFNAELRARTESALYMLSKPELCP